MNTEKQIGKIKNIKLGYGGYQDAMLGLTVELGSDKESWGVCDFKGFWNTERTVDCQWTETDREQRYGKVLAFIGELLSKAKKRELSELRGVPVLVEIEGGSSLKSWRILEEAI